MTTLREKCWNFTDRYKFIVSPVQLAADLEAFALEIERETIDRCILVIGCECEYCCCCLMKKEFLALKTEGGKNAGALAAEGEV